MACNGEVACKRVANAYVRARTGCYALAPWDYGLTGANGEQMVMAFEDEFAVEIPDAEAEKIHTVEQAVTYIASHSQAK